MERKSGHNATQVGLEASFKMERAWRILTYPKRYSQQQIEEAHFLERRVKHILIKHIENPAEGTNIHSINFIYMGLYHHREGLIFNDPGQILW